MSAEPDIDLPAAPATGLADDAAVDAGIAAPAAEPGLGDEVERVDEVELGREFPSLFPEPSPVPAAEVIGDAAPGQLPEAEALMADLFAPATASVTPGTASVTPAEPAPQAAGGQAVSVDPASLAASIAAAVAASVGTSIAAALGPVLAAARPAPEAVAAVADTAPAAPVPPAGPAGVSDGAAVPPVPPPVPPGSDAPGPDAPDAAPRQARILSPYLGYLGYFVGAGLISGGVVHYPLDHERYALITAAGVALFLAATVLNEFVLAAVRPAGSAAARVIGSSLMLSMGIGMLSGGIQHFSDFPERATVLIPLGLVLSFAAYAVRHATGVRRAAVGMAGAAVVLVAATAFVTLDRFVATPSVDATGAHTHSTGEEDAAEDEEELGDDEDAEHEEGAAGDDHDADADQAEDDAEAGGHGLADLLEEDHEPAAEKAHKPAADEGHGGAAEEEAEHH
jgi:hypothetical protein